MTPQKELLQQCLCSKWGGPCGLDIPTVRDLLAMVIDQDPVTGCGSMAVSLPPIPVINKNVIDCAGATTTVPVEDKPASPIYFVGTGAPIPVCVTNPAPDYTALLTAIKNSVASIDTKSDNLALILAAVDGLEALVSTGNATLTSILTATNSILVQAQAINANTDQLEALLNTMTAVLQTESDQTQVAIGTTNTELATANTTLTALLTKLNEACGGNPINVNVCNPTPAAPDYTALLTAIKDSVASIDTKASDLANILLAVDGLEALLATGNANTANILVKLNDILVQAQAINANTDGLEALIGTTNSTLQSEFDATQVILNNMLAILQAPCGGATQNVNICNFPTPPTVNTITGGALPVIAGSAINATGTAFNGAPDTVDTSAIGGSLQSITITALDVDNGFKDGATPNQILVDMPDGTVSVVFDGQTQTFQVQKDTDQELRREYRIRATGKAYANIIYTFI